MKQTPVCYAYTPAGTIREDLRPSDPFGDYTTEQQAQLAHGRVQGHDMFGISNRGMLQGIDEGFGRQVYKLDEYPFAPRVFLSTALGLVLMALRQPGCCERGECPDNGTKQGRQR